ncbi:MAG TPA: NAD-dependent epimerase/dehydratase family protein [Acidimicrobiia bacterium]|jgi:UDP-glucose 4-epimerase|nr:NAD-dependent epimerase/dehydratase family protein [Acidimicrobiia bacterium]
MRVLVTGLSTYWGGRVAQALERRPDVDCVVGLDTRDPRVELERTEFVRADTTHSILARIVRATQVDTIVHTHLIVDSTRVTGRELHEINVIGTMNLLAAAGAPQSPVRKVVLKSSGLVYGANAPDPYVFREDMTRTGPARTNVERSLLEVEAFVRDFADDNPHVDVTLLRFANVLGDDIDTPFAAALRRPVVPEIFGFDPRVQFVHEDDVVDALMYATTNDIPGIYNVAGDGNLPWSEVCTIVGKRRVALPFLLTGVAAEPMRLLRVWDLPHEALQLMRFGRTVDNSRYKRAGFRYSYTSAGTVEAFAQGLRLAATVGDNHPSYRYERDVEDFFRHSPAVVRPD